MKELPTEWVTSFERRLDQAKVPQPLRLAYDSLVSSFNVVSQLPPRIKPLTPFCSFSGTMIYLQTVPTLTLKQAKSPLDCL